MLQWLEFEEMVGKVWHRWALSRSASFPNYPDAAVSLASITGPLAVFFRASGGSPGIAVTSAAARVSKHRLSLRQRLGLDEEALDIARLDEENLLLPPSIALFDTPELNRDLYFWLAAMLAVMEPTTFFNDPLRQDISALRQVVATTERVLDQFPGLHARYIRLKQAMLAIRPTRSLPPVEAGIEVMICNFLGADEALSPEMERYRIAILEPTTSLREFRAPKGYRRPLPVPLWPILSNMDVTSKNDADCEPEPTSKTDEQVVGKRKAERRRQDQSERDDPLVFNRFEKILSLAEMVNVNRMIDDDEDKMAKSNAEQIEEITLSPNQQRAASSLRMDLDLSPGAASGERQQGRYTYPEWNYRKRCYQNHHCLVLAGSHGNESDNWFIDDQTQRRIRRVRRQFEALRPRRQWLRGQVDGNELDMDAVIRAQCDFAAVGDSSTGLYLCSRAQARDLAVSILIDVSLSTDAWVEGERRVVDIEKEALLVLAHGLAACGDDYSISSFTSHRRHRVWVNTLKTFDESFSEVTERRIASLKPGHYTRMGAAIRHTAAELVKRPNRHRLLLVLSDGTPNDSDYYVGRYAIEDTRRAILDARQQELKVFGITIDRDAQHYIAHLFGPGGYAMVQKPEHLSMALPSIYRQIISS
jgi:nitric oxide reductase NorD protein